MKNQKGEMKLVILNLHFSNQFFYGIIINNVCVYPCVNEPLKVLEQN